MNTEDLPVFAQFSKALWCDSNQSQSVSVETLTAVALFDLDEEQSMDRATRALLQRASRDGAAANLQALDHPFYRLIPEERWVLSALHQVHWSYRRIAWILEVTEEQVAQLAWSARLRLATAHYGKRPVFYTQGTQFSGTHCPEYDLSAPWTQKFMDEEMPTRERLFLQNHLMACESCRKALMACREMYFAVESMIPVPRSTEADDGLSRHAQALRRAWDQTYKAARLGRVSWKRAGIAFLSNPRNSIPLVLVTAFLIWLAH